MGISGKMGVTRTTSVRVPDANQQRTEVKTINVGTNSNGAIAILAYERANSAPRANANTGLTAGSATLNLDYGAAQYYIVNLAANVSTISISNWLPSGNACRLSVEVRQTGNYTMTFPGIWSGGTKPTNSKGNGKIDLYVFTTVDGGNTVFGHTVAQDCS